MSNSENYESENIKKLVHKWDEEDNEIKTEIERLNLKTEQLKWRHQQIILKRRIQQL